MDAKLEREVWRRAEGRCEYCLIPQSTDITPHQIDHIIARKHRGQTSSENLALSCLQCNAHKGPNIAGIDPTTGLLCRLFHPRSDVWKQHFALLPNGELTSRTEVGRATISVLDMNDADAISIRRLLIAAGELVPEAI